MCQFRIAFDPFDLQTDPFRLRLEPVHVDLAPWQIRDGQCELMLVLQQSHGVGHLPAAAVGVLQRPFRPVKLAFQFGQIPFVHEADDLTQAFDAMEATVAGFDLPVDLHLPFGPVHVVDRLHATRVEPLRRGLLLQPSDERRILLVPQLRRHPPLVAGRIVLRVGIDETPGTPRHTRRIDRADLRGEPLLMPLVHENGLRDGRVRDVHRQTPLLVPLVHVHQFGHVRQFRLVQARRPCDERARMVHVVADARPVFDLAPVILPQQVAFALPGVTFHHHPLVFGSRVFQTLVVRVERQGERGAFGVPCLLVGGESAFDAFEPFGDGVPLSARLVGVLACAFEVLAELLQAAAVDAVHAFFDGFDLRVEFVDALLRPVDGVLGFLGFALRRWQSGAYFAGHARPCPCGERRLALLAVGVDGRVFAAFAGLFGVFAVAGLYVLQDGDAFHFVFHAVEVLAEPVVVVDGFAGEPDGFGHVEHALFEDVVEFGGRVGGLDLVQEPACFGA